ncbi:MAG TPA: hypothetical protein VFP56_00715 [Candidatus Limnocylindrales bacterium]|nr:hypothetical protein [Candidatus Limnocylindrales bacterium]
MTEQRRDTEMDITGGETGSETAENETSVGQADSGSMGAGAGHGSLAGQMESGWQGQVEGQDGGAIGQEGVLGGEGWEGRSRDIGTSGFNTGDAGFGSETSDDGGPNRGTDGSDS